MSTLRTTPPPDSTERDAALGSRAPDDASCAPVDGEPLVIRLRDVAKRFGTHTVFSDLTLDIPRGKTTVVLGRSGSGKSVLIKLMNGLMLPDDGEVEVFGVNTRRADGRQLVEMRRRVSTMFQNYALFDSMTVEDNVAFPLRENTDRPDVEIRRRVEELLELLGLPGTGRLFPSELSGGMKKRVSLARALITDPEVVLFDEPTTGLDPVMIEFVDNLLIETREKFGLTSVIISHDMASVFKLADRVAMLHEGRVSFCGTPDELARCTRPEVRAFVGAGDSRLEDAGPGDSAPTPAREGTVDPEKIVVGEQVEGALRWEDLPPTDEPPIVTVRDLRKSFGSRSILKGVNLYALPGRITTVIGGSGSGKSVMMKHILGLLRPDSGSVQVLGREIVGMGERDLIETRRNFGMLFQSAALFDSMTVRENVMFPLLESPGARLSRREAREKADAVLEKLGIVELGDKLPSDVSGGQRKRVGLARAIVTEPRILIYDEPTTGLDPVMTNYVNDMIVEAQEAFRVTGLVISHDMASSFRISHHVAMLWRGAIIAFGTPSEILASPHPRVREFIFA